METSATKEAHYTIENNSNNDVTLLVFYVKAARDATVHFRTKHKKYKIVLGAQNTTRCGITSTALINCDKDIISSEEWRGFWIEIIPSKQSIKVGRKGSELNFMNHSASNEIPIIRDFQFSSGKGDTTKWGVDCTTDNGKLRDH